MVEEYHQLSNVAEVNDQHALTIPRAKALLDALQHHRDYSLVQLLQHSVEGVRKLECLIVDVECDDVPKKNLTGIRYRERLALCVPDDPNRLIEVLALRKTFPILLHQNQGERDAPASLCLYFEPPVAVRRTWTPQNFLRRIQWWLEKSSRGELHPADQPVEHLFFSTKYELVLPWNFDDLRKDDKLRLIIHRGDSRPDEGLTCFVNAIPKATPSPVATLAHIGLTLSPIVHGFVERDPQTLGQLANLLLARGVDIVPMLQTELRQRVGEGGTAESAEDTFTIILLHIPVTRTLGEQPERMSLRAFMVSVGAMKLGVEMGVLFKHEQKYFNAAGILGAQPATEWRSRQLQPMDVLYRNDPAAARRQSGILDEGPVGVLIGVGSLGSAMLNLWGRSGWGRWSVIDKDHIKPHNLTRHVAYSQNVGETKVLTVAQLHDAVMQGASQVTPVFGDATDINQVAVNAALSSAALVVDASTTIDYPRLASANDDAARHMSAFVAPNGNAAVLLAEDDNRLFRLRTLEAQYYRALIQETWGQEHLGGNLSSFWSGASCRDISMVMPYSRVVAHASTLAEQIAIAWASPTAQIRVWERDPLRGRVDVHDVPVHLEQRLEFADLNLFIDEGAKQQLRALRAASLPNETGGILLGYYDFNIKAIVIVVGLPAPTDSRSDPASFKRGVDGLASAVSEASRRTAGIVRYIGEWHSHPRGHSASPSQDDLVQLIYLAMGMADDGLPGVQLIVGEHDIQVLQGVLK